MLEEPTFHLFFVLFNFLIKPLSAEEELVLKRCMSTNWCPVAPEEAPQVMALHILAGLWIHPEHIVLHGGQLAVDELHVLHNEGLQVLMQDNLCLADVLPGAILQQLQVVTSEAEIWNAPCIQASTALQERLVACFNSKPQLAVNTEDAAPLLQHWTHQYSH